MGKARILVIDDEPAMRAVLNRVLRDAGYDVAFAADGANGLVEYRKAPADVVIVDLYMPDKDGLETIVELGKASPVPAIIAMSGHRTKDLMLHSAERLGALEVIGKPFEPEALLQMVGKVLQREW